MNDGPPAWHTFDMHDLPVHLWFSITRLGGVGLTLPLAFAIALWVALGYSWRLAVGWLRLLGAADRYRHADENRRFSAGVSACANGTSRASAGTPCSLRPSTRSHSF